MLRKVKMQNIRKYILATIILLVLDFVWIGTFMGQRYKQMVKKIQGGKAMKVKLYSAFLAYALMVVGLNVFVVPNIRKGKELEDSLKYGFTFGMVVYGVYDFTAGAVLENWDMKLALVDILWGGFVYFISAYISSMVY